MVLISFLIASPCNVSSPGATWHHLVQYFPCSPVQLFPIQPNHLHGDANRFFPCLPVTALPVFTLVPHAFPFWSQLQFSHWPHSTWRHPSEPGPWPIYAHLHPHYALSPAPLMNTLTSQGNKSDPSLYRNIDSTITCPPPGAVTSPDHCVELTSAGTFHSLEAEYWSKFETHACIAV